MQPPKNNKNSTRRESAPQDNRLKDVNRRNDISQRMKSSPQKRRSNNDVLARQNNTIQERLDRTEQLERFDRPEKSVSRPQKQIHNAKQKKKVSQKTVSNKPKVKKQKLQPIEKTIVKSVPKNKKKKRAKQNYALYYIFAIIFLAGIAFVLANTVLFNTKQIIVEGETAYSHEEIISKSKLKYGENLFRVDTKKARDKILENFINIEEVKVERKYFSSEVRISIVTAVPFLNAQNGNENYIISERGRVISNEPTPRAGLVIVKGLNITAETPFGKSLDEIDENKYHLVKELLGYISENELNSVGIIDVSDKFNISFIVDNRITCQLGANEKLKDKIHAAAVTIRERIQPNEKVVLLLNNPEKVFVKNTNDDFAENPPVSEQAPPQSTQNP